MNIFSSKDTVKLQMEGKSNANVYDNVFSRTSMVFCIIPLIKVNKKSTVNNYFAVTNN